MPSSCNLAFSTAFAAFTTAGPVEMLNGVFLLLLYLCVNMLVFESDHFWTEQVAHIPGRGDNGFFDVADFTTLLGE